MGLENAKDSFNDLREMGRKSTTNGGRRKANNASSSKDAKSTSFRIRKKAGGGSVSPGGGGGGLSGASDSLNDLRLINYRKGGPPSPGWNYGYEPSEQNDDDSEDGDEQWPIFELTAAGIDMNSACAASPPPAAASSPNGHYTPANNGGTTSSPPPIIDCERIFTVPEVFDELQSTRTLQKLSSLVLRDEESSSSSPMEQCTQPCQNILHCLTPWKQNVDDSCCNLREPKRKPCHYNDAFIETQPSSHEKISPEGIAQRTSAAVQLYSGMPSSIRRSFAPSMFKVRFNDDTNTHDNNPEASLVGYDHRYVYSLGKDSIINDKNGVTTTAPRATAASPPPQSTHTDKRKYRVHFSEIKRVLKVRKFTPDEATEVWFQRDDFDHFKAEMTLLIQEVEASRELAEVWLDAKSDSNSQHGKSNSDCQSSTTSPAHHDANGTLERGHLQRSDSRRKARAWWHNYDHSRRGLERYASPGQARQILASYKVAVQKVLGEQRRQRILRFLCIPNAYDPEKIAEVYHEYTAWSRDLALAAGASDADAVSTNFDDDKRHTREYYVLKQVIASGYKVHKHMPQFMLPRCITPTGYLNELESFHSYENGKDVNAVNARRRPNWQLLRRESSTGASAREEMSRVTKSDLIGPVAPSLAPSLRVKEEGKDVHPSSSSGNGVHHHSMAEKAKNFPFQQQ